MKLPFSGLLVALFLMLLAVPPLSSTPFGFFFLTAVSWGVLALGVLVVGKRGRLRNLVLAIAALAVVEDIAELWFTTTPFLVASNATHGLYLAVLSVLIVRHVVKQSQVTLDVVLGGVCVYMLLGLLFFQAFNIIETLSPGSFLDRGEPFPAIDGGEVVRTVSLIYFSYVTLSTLGYGDIVPVDLGARVLCNLEAIVGQVYLTILVAYLVGTLVSQRNRGDGAPDNAV